MVKFNTLLLIYQEEILNSNTLKVKVAESLQLGKMLKGNPIGQDFIQLLAQDMVIILLGTHFHYAFANFSMKKMVRQ